MKTDFSPSLRTSQTALTSPVKRAESSPLRQAGASSFEASSPLRQTERTGAVQRTGVSGIDSALADKGSKTLEDVLTRFGSGISPISSKDPFERLSSLTQQVSDLFQKDPSVIDQVRADKQLFTSIQRIAKRMLDRIPQVPSDIANTYRMYVEMAAKLEPIEPKPILP